MELLILHPQIYHRDCQHCLKYFYDEETGKPRTGNDGRLMERPPRTYAPCRNPKGSECPKGAPENPALLTEDDLEVFETYKACKMTGIWPADDWTVKVFVKISDLLEQCDKIRDTKLRVMEMQVLSGGFASK